MTGIVVNSRSLDSKLPEARGRNGMTLNSLRLEDIME